MNAQSFYWHDYETFGVVPRRDRPVQFGGLRTDLDLNPIGEPLLLHCRPADDFLPDPDSVLLTGITPQHALAHGVPEHQFAARIEAELGTEGTIGVGYNSLRFDDEVTRHLFWRNLIDPYAREWRNGNARWDLMDVLRCCWALRPEGIVWPTHKSGELQGRPSFKLEHLTAANGVPHVGAHDALADVRATLGMARLVKQHQPRLWDFCLRLRHKQAVWDEIGHGRPFVHLSGRYAAERGCIAVVWPLAAHPRNKNELIVWDLAHDPRELADLDTETMRRRLFTRADELPEGETRLPIKTIHVNKSPIVIHNLKTVQGAAQRWGLDLAQAELHAGYAAAQAAAVGSRLDERWPEVFARADDGMARDVDEDLYGGFIGDADRRTLDRLRALASDAAAGRRGPDALATRRVAFEDGRLDELLFRWRARNFRDTLDAEDAQRWERHRADRLHRGAGGALTLAACFERIDALAEAADERGDGRASALLQQLYDYAEGIAPEP